MDPLLLPSLRFQSRCSGFCFFYLESLEALLDDIALKVQELRFQSRCSGFCFFYASMAGIHIIQGKPVMVSIPLLGILFFLPRVVKRTIAPTNGFNPVARDFVFSTLDGRADANLPAGFNPVARDFVFSTGTSRMPLFSSDERFNPVARDFVFSTVVRGNQMLWDGQVWFQSRCSGFCFFYSASWSMEIDSEWRISVSIPLLGILFFLQANAKAYAERSAHVSIPLLGILFFLPTKKWRLK